MKQALRYILATCLFLIGLISYSQYGVNIRYFSNDFKGWSDVATENSGGPIWNNNIEYAVDYWFRPEEIRTEYYVEGTFSSANTTQSTVTQCCEYDLNSVGVAIRSHVYVFDFQGDCDCPTFKKEGGFLKKGFFLQYGAGAALWLKSIDVGANHNNVAIDLNAGAGFDIGISDLLTITPYTSYHYLPNVNYDGFAESQPFPVGSDVADNTSVTRLRFGIRVGFRPDFLQERRALYR